MVIESKEPRNLRERKNELCLCPVCRIEGSGFVEGFRVEGFGLGEGCRVPVGCSGWRARNLCLSFKFWLCDSEKYLWLWPWLRFVL